MQVGDGVLYKLRDGDASPHTGDTRAAVVTLVDGDWVHLTVFLSPYDRAQPHEIVRQVQLTAAEVEADQGASDHATEQASTTNG